MSQLTKGYIQVYTGNGKGKTTAAFGQALRAAGGGLKTFIFQFMKDLPYGEVKSIRPLSDWIRLEQYGNDAFVFDKELPNESDFEAAKLGLQRATEAMLSGKYDIVMRKGALFILKWIKFVPDETPASSPSILFSWKNRRRSAEIVL